MIIDCKKIADQIEDDIKNRVAQMDVKPKLAVILVGKNQASKLYVSKKEEFAKRNVKAIALSVDSVESHHGWIQDINDTQSTTVNFPILADGDRKVSELYDMIHPNANETLTVRSLFVIDPKKKVRLIITYPASTGRNFNEILRVIDSLQLTDNHSVATPGNWQDGDDVVIVPSLKDEEVIRQKFPKGYKAVRPYLRLTPQPNK